MVRLIHGLRYIVRKWLNRSVVLTNPRSAITAMADRMFRPLLSPSTFSARFGFIRIAVIVLTVTSREFRTRYADLGLGVSRFSFNHVTRLRSFHVCTGDHLGKMSLDLDPGCGCSAVPKNLLWLCRSVLPLYPSQIGASIRNSFLILTVILYVGWGDFSVSEIWSVDIYPNNLMSIHIDFLVHTILHSKIYFENLCLRVLMVCE